MMVCRTEQDVPKGLKVSDKDSATIVFHVLVPLEYWEWDSTSVICLQFDHKDLGKWKYDCGYGKFVRRYYFYYNTK